MKNILLENEIKEIKNNEWVIFSTSNLNNEPHAIVVMPSRVEEDKIILSNIQMQKTIKNLEENPKCFINIYLKEQEDKQIKIDGIAKVYNEGELFQEIKDYEETNNLPEDLKVNSIIIVEIKTIEITEG